MAMPPAIRAAGGALDVAGACLGPIELDAAGAGCGPRRRLLSRVKAF